MRALNKNNYEEWALDFLEGKLSEQEQEQFNTFLLLNPEIASELEMMKEGLEHAIPTESEKFILKDNLKSNLPPHLAQQSWDDLMIALLEKDLPAKEQELLLKAFEKNSGLKRDWDLYQLTKLPLNEELVFGDKSKLYKKPAARIISINRPVLYRAAAILLLFGIGINLWFREEISYRPVGNHFESLAMSALPGLEESEIMHAQAEVQKVPPTHVFSSTKDGRDATTSAPVKKTSPEKISPQTFSFALAAPNHTLVPELNQALELLPMESPGTILASTPSRNPSNDAGYFDLTRPVKSFASWVKQQGNKRLNLPEDRMVEVPGSVEYASAGAALLERITGRNFALEPKFNDQGKMNDLSLRAGNYHLMLK